LAKTILILGAGTGGLVAASRLRRMLDREHRIVLVDRSPFYTFAPSLSWVMLGERKIGRLSRDLRKLERKGIEFITGEVKSIDVNARNVRINDTDITYDYLVIALGVEYSAEEVPGLNRAWTYYHADGAEGIQEELPKFAGGRVLVVAPSLPYRCPPSLYEGAFLLDHYFRKRKLRHAVEIAVYTPEPVPLREAGAEIGEHLLEMLRDRDIGFTGGVTMKSVNHEKKLANFHEVDPVPFDMLVAAPVHRLPYVLHGTGLIGEDGWIAVERDQLSTVAPDVYAVGDCNSVEIAGGLTLPKSGVFAHGQAEVVARNITAEISGKDPIWAFGGQGACFMETGGGRGSYIVGNYFTDPPKVHMRKPGRTWHLAKAGFERIWLWRWF